MKKQLLILMLIIGAISSYADDIYSGQPHFRVASENEYLIDPIEQGAYEGALRLIDEQNRHKGIKSNYVDKSTNKIAKTQDNIDFVPIAQYTDDNKFYTEFGSIRQNLNREKLHFHSVHNLITGGIKGLEQDGSIDESSYIQAGNNKRFFFGNGNTVNDIKILETKEFNKELDTSKENNKDRYLIDGGYKSIDYKKRNQLDISMNDYYNKIQGKSKDEVCSYLKEKMLAKGINVVEKDGELYTEDNGKLWKVYWTIEPVTIPETELPERPKNPLKDDIYTRIYTYNSTQDPNDSAGKILYTKDGNIVVEDKYDYKSNQILINTKGYTAGTGEKGIYLDELIKKIENGESIGDTVVSQAIQEYIGDKKNMDEATFKAKWITPFEKSGVFKENEKKLNQELSEAKKEKEIIDKKVEISDKKLEDLKDYKPSGIWRITRFSSQADIDNFLIGKTEKEKEYTLVYVENIKSKDKQDELDLKIQYDIPKKYGVYEKGYLQDDKKWLSTVIDSRNIILHRLGKHVEFRGKGTILGTVDLGEGMNELTISGQLSGKYGTNIILGPYAKLKNIHTVKIGRDLDSSEKGATSGSTSLSLDIDPNIKNEDGQLVQHAFKDSDKNIIFLQSGKEITGDETDEIKSDFNIQLMVSKISEDSVVNMGRKLKYKVKDITHNRDVNLKIRMTSDSIAHILIDDQKEAKDGNSLLNVKVKDKIKRLSDGENEVYKSIVDSKNLGLLYPTLTSTNKKTVFGYNENLEYNRKKVDLATYLKTKSSEDIIKDLSQFYFGSTQEEETKNYIKAIQDKKEEDFKTIAKKMENNKQAIINKQVEIKAIETQISDEKEKIDKINTKFDKLSKLKSSNEYNSLDFNTQSNKINNINIDNIYKKLDEGYSDYTDSATVPDANLYFTNIKNIVDSINTINLDNLTSKYDSDFKIISEIKDTLTEAKEELDTYEGASWRAYTVGPLKRAASATKKLRDLMTKLYNYSDIDIKAEIKEVEDKIKSIENNLYVQKDSLENLKKVEAEETEDVLYSKMLEGNPNYQNLRLLLFYTLREEEALKELKEIISQLKDTNIYSKVNKISKNEISTYTNIPFDINRSLIEKKHYTRGGFISNRTVQDNFKGNIYTAYGIYEYKFKENASFGFMVGGANTNHKITHNKRSAESTPTDSTVKGTSAYLGTYFNQEVLVPNINWISGLGAQYGHYKTERHLKNNYQGFDSKGKVKVKGLNTYTGLVISYPIQEDVALQLKGILSYTFLQQGKTKENEGLAIDVDSKNYNYLDSEVGIGMSKTLYDIDGKSNLTASISGISGLYGYKNDDLKARIAGSTSSFNIKGDRVKKDAVKILIDYNVQKATGFNYGLEGTYISNSDESNVKIGVKAGYVF